MRRRPVDSAAINSIGYDGEHATLEIEFVGGDVYQYFLVPASVHTQFLAADSVGNYFAAHIRNRYEYRRV
ncbi:MAG: KTSC domain-containing protein [Jatrophihabitantaceae bacterium]